MIIALFDPELSAKNGIASACVDQVTSANVLRRAAPFHAQVDMLVCNLDALDGCLLMHVRPTFGGMIEQHLVEIGARNLIRVVGLGTEPVLEVKFGSLLGTRAKDFAAEFFHEPGAQEFFVQPQPAKRFHAERQEGFANVKPWKFFAFKHDNASPGASEQCSRSATGRPSTDDSNIVHIRVHCGPNLSGN